MPTKLAVTGVPSQPSLVQPDWRSGRQPGELGMEHFPAKPALGLDPSVDFRFSAENATTQAI
jgi:hypothetical protein